MSFEVENVVDLDLSGHPAHVRVNDAIASLCNVGDYGFVKIQKGEAEGLVRKLREYREEHEKLRVGNLDYAERVSELLRSRCETVGIQNSTPPAAPAPAPPERLMEIACAAMRDQAVQLMRVVLEELAIWRRDRDRDAAFDEAIRDIKRGKSG